MEATTADAHEHHHHHHDDVEVNPATWSDPKRYAWLLGIVVPLAPFMAWGSVALTGFGGFWYSARCSSSSPSRSSTSRSGWTPPTRPTASSSCSSRIATTAGAPTSSSRSSTPAWCWPAGCGRAAASQRLRKHRPGADDGRRRRDRDQHRPRARPQAGELGALAQPRRARADRLRPLLHRAQPRPPRARRHPRGPGQLAAGGELLGLPAAHRRRQPALGLGDRGAPASTASASRTGRCATTCSAPGR